MADLIDRQKIKAKFEPWLNVKGYSEGELNIIRAVLYEIAIMPSAQPDVPGTTFGNMISRQAAIDTVRSYYDECDEREESIEERIERLPSAERVAHWEKGRCSRCHAHAPFWAMASTYYLSNYCPNCGARMDGEHDG